MKNTKNTPKWKRKRLNVPSILQMEAIECGAAALAMILAYYGRFVPLEQLRVECGVSRDGSKASNLLKAARQYGLEAKGYRKEPEEVREFQLPMILFWNFNHFVVLTGIKGKKVYINDPAGGPRELSYEEFDKAFTGIVLVFEPGPNFEKGGEKFSIVKALKKRAQRIRTALVYVVLASLFLVIPGLVIPTFSRVFLDNILVGQMYGWIRPLLLGMLMTAVLRGVLTWIQNYYLLRLETKMALSWSAKFFQHVFRLPITFFLQRQTGDIGERVQSNDQVARLLSGELARNMLNAIMVVFYAALMFQYDALLAGIGVAIALVNVGVLKYVSQKRILLNKKLRQDRGKLIGTTMSGLQMIETLKATGAENDFFAAWAGYQAKVFNAQQELGLTTRTFAAIPPLLSTLNNIAVLVVGGLRVMQGHLSVGMLVAFQSLMRSFIAPVNGLMDVSTSIQDTVVSVNRLDDVFNYQVDTPFVEVIAESEIPPKGRQGCRRSQEMLTLVGGEEEGFVKLQGYVELKNVSFGYNPLDPPLIKDFNLALKPGSRVALVGKSGSGKSTVAKLLTGVYHPWKGDILFDGKPREAYPRSVMTNSMAAVDQEIFLFGGTIRENLSMWDTAVPDLYIVHGGKDACIHDDISARPGSYDGDVEEGGRNFSGGQRQRLEIARALVVEPSILVLDEATSALDTKTEKTFDDNVRRRGCTTVIVAHRLSTIRDADEIIVLDKGKVVQRGIHEEMIENANSPYAKLIQAH